MKRTATTENLSFVMPITDCLYSVPPVMPIPDYLYSLPSVVNLTFRASVPIAEQLDTQGGWVDLSVELNDVLENEEQTQETQGTDPLLGLVGTLECEMSNIDDMTPSEMRRTKADQAQEAQVSDPLLRLVGTLECEVTDIGERHDDYIGDSLLAELKRDNDE